MRNKGLIYSLLCILSFSLGVVGFIQDKVLKSTNTIINSTPINNTNVFNDKDPIINEIVNTITEPIIQETIIEENIVESKSEIKIETKKVVSSLNPVKNVIYTNEYYNEVINYLKNIPNRIINNPMIYLYNTHQTETYSINLGNYYTHNIDVLGASYILREKLIDLGIPTFVETRNVINFLNDNGLPSNLYYLATERFARDAKNKYPSIKYFIDIHRDAAKYNETIYKHDNKSYAKILLIKGFEHTLPENNINASERLFEIINRDYPGIFRGIEQKYVLDQNITYYNSNLDGVGFLLEVGGVDNTIDEVYNTMEVIAKALKEYINIYSNVKSNIENNNSDISENIDNNSESALNENDLDNSNDIVIDAKTPMESDEDDNEIDADISMDNNKNDIVNNDAIIE